MVMFSVFLPSIPPLRPVPLNVHLYALADGFDCVAISINADEPSDAALCVFCVGSGNGASVKIV